MSDLHEMIDALSDGNANGSPGSSDELLERADPLIAVNFLNSNSNLYNPIWHRSQCCGVKWGARALRVRSDVRGVGNSS